MMECDFDGKLIMSKGQSDGRCMFGVCTPEQYLPLWRACRREDVRYSVALVASMDGEPVRRRLCLKSKQWKHKPVTEQQVVQTTWILRAIESYAVRL